MSNDELFCYTCRQPRPPGEHQPLNLTDRSYGRIRRQVWFLWVGDEKVDMDELRCYGFPAKLEPLLANLVPHVTPAEVCGLLQILGLHSWPRHVLDEFCAMITRVTAPVLVEP